MKDALKILKDLNEDLLLYLNEMYMIDEFLEVRNFLERNNIKNNKIILNIKDIIIKNAKTLQTSDEEKYEELIDNFNDFYEVLTNKDFFSCEMKGYYDLLRNIFYKEIKKVLDINYRERIFCYLIKHKEIIVNSKEIFQILFHSIINPKKESFDSINNILNSNNIILTKIENILSSIQIKRNYYSLYETLLYFFEKNSFIYLNNQLINTKKSKKNKNLDDKDFLEFFDECINYLIDFFNAPDQFKNKQKEVYKLFCFGFIKVYCYLFITYIKQGNKKLKNVNNII